MDTTDIDLARIEADEPRYHWQDLEPSNIADLLGDAASTLPYGPDGNELLGIVDEVDGGIIAYAIGEEHANRIVEALNGPQS